MAEQSTEKAGEAVNVYTRFPLRSGTLVDLKNVQITDIVIQDIAISLSRLPRYNGHSIFNYSVGQHSVYVSELVEMWGGSPEEQLWGLLHDVHESLLGELTRPARKLFPDYDNFAKSIDQVIGLKYGIGDVPMIVHKADDFILSIEKRDVIKKCVEWDIRVIQPIGLTDYKRIEMMDEYAVRKAFLHRFQELRFVIGTLNAISGDKV